MDDLAPALLYDAVARFRCFDRERAKTSNYRDTQCRKRHSSRDNSWRFGNARGLSMSRAVDTNNNKFIMNGFASAAYFWKKKSYKYNELFL